MSFKGMTTPTRDDVNISLNLKEEHVTEYTTVFPATVSEQNPLQIHLNQTGGPSHSHQLSKPQGIPSKPHDPEEW